MQGFLFHFIAVALHLKPLGSHLGLSIRSGTYVESIAGGGIVNSLCPDWAWFILTTQTMVLIWFLVCVDSA